jgi:hypothetical protein
MIQTGPKMLTRVISRKERKKRIQKVRNAPKMMETARYSENIKNKEKARKIRLTFYTLISIS